MTQISRILCVIDPTQDSQPALQRASWYAEQSGAALDLLTCYYNEYLSGNRFFDSTSLRKGRAEMLNVHKQKLEELAKPLRMSGLNVSTTAIWDNPLYEGIVRQSVALKADVVFKDTHYHSALSRALLTNTDWSLIRTCPVPLWLVSPVSVEEKPNIIAAIDPFNDHDKPAALDDQILMLGKEIATSVDGNLHAFHAYDPRAALATATANAYIPVSLPLDEIERDMRQQHKKKFSEMTEFYGIPEDRAHLASGFTHEVLPEIATDLSAVVVIMGAVSRNKLKRLYIGATAEQTLGRLPCDLLVIKLNPFTTPVELDVNAVA
jgi:universal stress protein E